MIQQNLLSKLHDAELVSVEINRLEKKIVLSFRDVNDKLEKLIFCDAVAFRINDLILQNVISRLIISTNSSLPDEEIIDWITWTNSLDETTMITSESINKYVKQIKNNELTLFLMEPSWGAEGAILCKSIRFDE